MAVELTAVYRKVPEGNNPGVDFRPRWFPDGTKIAFTSDRDPAGAFDIIVMNAVMIADGSVPADLSNTLEFADLARLPQAGSP